MRVIYLVSVLLLSACSLASLGLGPSKREETAIYTLKPQNMAAITPNQNCGEKTNLKVSEPIPVAGLDTHRIAILQGEARYNYYTGARWAAPPSQMLQSILVEAFEQSKAFNSVSSDLEAVEANLNLVSEIRNFEVTESNAGVHLRLMAKLVDVKTGKVLTPIAVEKTITPTGGNMETIIAAFNQAAAQAASEIVTTSVKALPSCKKAKTVKK